MDTDNSPARQSRQVAPKVAALTRGGTVEPANRATVAKERFQTPVDVPGERYELRTGELSVSMAFSQSVESEESGHGRSR